MGCAKEKRERRALRRADQISKAADLGPSVECIVSRLRQRRLAGDMPDDIPLPSVRALARRHAVGPATVQAAYRALASEGLVKSRPRVGWFVVPRAGQMRRRKALAILRMSIQSPIRRALASGLSRHLIRREILRKLSRRTASPAE